MGETMYYTKVRLEPYTFEELERMRDRAQSDYLATGNQSPRDKVIAIEAELAQRTLEHNEAIRREHEELAAISEEVIESWDPWTFAGPPEVES